MALEDGGLFSFGGAPFFGCMGGKSLNKPVVGVTSAPEGVGYWLMASDGGIFNFANARFAGSLGGPPSASSASSGTPAGQGYALVEGNGDATWQAESEDPRPRRLTSLRCPDCRGSLWEQENNSRFRFHCHTGHSFSTGDLDEAQLDDLEGALWSAVVALEDRAEFLRGIRSRMGDRAHQRVSDEIAETELQAVTLRDLISTGFAARHRVRHSGSEPEMTAG